MSESVFVVSEWLPKKGYEQEVWVRFKQLMALTKENEKNCVSAHATKQISHLGSPGASQYSIVLLQEYTNLDAFNVHCKASYVTDFFKNYIENKEASIIEDWCCRLFSEKEEEKINEKRTL